MTDSIARVVDEMHHWASLCGPTQYKEHIAKWATRLMAMNDGKEHEGAPVGHIVCILTNADGHVHEVLYSDVPDWVRVSDGAVVTSCGDEQ